MTTVLPQPNEDKPDGSSVAGSKGKRKAKPTGKRRNRKQKVKETYAKAREDAQLADVIPTTPEGAVRDERVDPRTQTTPPMPGLVALAVRGGWATPEDKKQAMVDELVGIVNNPEMPAKVKVAAFSALRMADQHQWERDHPEDAGRAKGGASVSIQTNITAVQLLNRMLDDPTAGIADLTPPDITSPPGDSG